MQSKPHRIGLSERGFDAFIACHNRLASLTRSFNSHGTTLYVAVRIADALDTETIADEFGRPRTVNLGGKKFHNLGIPVCFRPMVARIIERVDASGIYWKKPRPGEIYQASLTMMTHADNFEVIRAYKGMLADIDGKYPS
jgi:hypothetical protein